MDKRDPIGDEVRRRQQITTLIIGQFEESCKHLDAAAAALTQNLPVEMKAYDCTKELLEGAQCLQASVRHILEALQWERGPNAAGYMTFPGLAEYLEAHPPKPDGAKQP